MNRTRISLVAAAVALSALALAATKGSNRPTAVPPEVQRAIKSFSPEAMRAHDQFLASDLLEGRAPGTRGDTIAEEYIAAQFAASGLEPAGEKGTFFQTVPLLGVTLEPDRSSISFTHDGSPAIGPLKFLDQFVGSDASQSEASTLDSDLIFVGHGVVAPEYNWDDYKGLDVRGKTLVMLVDDPPANEKEPRLFEGRRRTYYGRWTYKYEIAAAKGAQAVVLIHTDDAAGYGWNVVRNSWGREKAFMRLKMGEPALHFESWVTQPVARDLFRAAGLDLDALTKAAASRDFRPVPMNGWKLSGNVTSSLRPFETRNVVARLKGSDPKLRDEAVLYSAHHDHLGIGTPDAKGDRIYNGAADNATGCALLLDLGRVWAKASPAPKRSILFAAVAAEEQGLLGSEYFGQNPVVPAGRIALGINYDNVFEVGRVRDVTMIGAEKMSFYPTVQRVAKALNLTIVPDQQPEQGSYYRSDHFSIAKAGIPAFSIGEGLDVIGKPAGWGRAYADDFRKNRYHQPSDEFDPTWDWSTAVQMGELGYWLGWEAANAPTLPNWNAGSEFKAARDKSLEDLK